MHGPLVNSRLVLSLEAITHTTRPISPAFLYHLPVIRRRRHSL